MKKKCDFCEDGDNQEHCRRSLLSALEDNIFSAEESMKCVENYRLDLFSKALKILKEQAQKGRPGFGDLYFKYEGQYHEIASNYYDEAQKQREKDELLLSCMEISPADALQVLKDVMKKSKELIYKVGRKLMSLCRGTSDRSLGYRQVYLEYEEMLKTIPVKDLEMLHYVCSVEDCFEDMDLSQLPQA